MKKMQWMGIAAMAILLGTGFSACSEESEPVAPGQEQEQEYVTVGLGIAGEYLEFRDTPMETRTNNTAKDLYCIAVYEVTRGTNTLSETKYAYGAFTSLDNVSIKLLEGQEYRFVASIIVNGCECSEDGIENTGGHYCDGFGVSLNTGFVYSTDFNLSNFDGYPEKYGFDRFYGELSEYIPLQNSMVKIETKRVSYSVKFIVEQLTEGKVNIGVHNFFSSNLYSVDITPSNLSHEGIYSFMNFRTAWRGLRVKDEESGTYEYVNYVKEKQLTVNWTKDDGSMTSLGTYNVTFKRNVKTTIRIKVGEETGIQNGIVITREDTSWDDDENEYVIAGGEVTLVPVTEE